MLAPDVKSVAWRKSGECRPAAADMPDRCMISSISRLNSAPITTRPSRSCSRGEGVWLWDVDGNRYLDCLSAYSAVNQGHCHPKIYQALVDQARTLTLTSRAFHNDQLALFYKELCELTRSHKVLPMNSGAEAVERDQDGPEVGLRGERRAGGPGRDHRLPQQLPRPDHRHRRLQHRSDRPPRLWSVCACSRPSRSATPMRCRPPSPPTPLAFSSSRSRGKPA